MLGIVEFLRARFAEDEEAARACIGVNALARHINGEPIPRWERYEGTQIRSTDEYRILRVGHTWAAEAEHITRWDPARVLVECEVKRRIVDAESQWRRTKECVTASTQKSSDEWVDVTWLDQYFHLHEERVTVAEYRDRFTDPALPSDTLRLLALPYADHPDFSEDWKI